MDYPSGNNVLEWIFEPPDYLLASLDFIWCPSQEALVVSHNVNFVKIYCSINLSKVMANTSLVNHLLFNKSFTRCGSFQVQLQGDFFNWASPENVSRPVGRRIAVIADLLNCTFRLFFLLSSLTCQKKRKRKIGWWIDVMTRGVTPWNNEENI